MIKYAHISRILLAGGAIAALSACGASDVASPGTGGDVVINNPTPTPTTPTPTDPTGTVTPAGGCPTTASGTNGFTDLGVFDGPTGSWRVCALPTIVNKSMTLAKIPGLIYAMNGRVDVGCDGGFSAPTGGAGEGTAASRTVSCTAANGITLDGSGKLTADTNVTLTVEPGVILAGWTGQSWLAVNRGNKLMAEGTSSKPIIFTSKDNVLGFETDSSIGHWGGVVLMGRGKVTDCDFGSVGANTCERKTEGSPDPAIFGGIDDAYNAGSMKYVQIRYSGYVLGADKELQALTTEGVGSGTKFDYIQSHNSSDDGMELFGGVVQFKHYIATGADDDSLDADTGVRASLQYVLLLQRPGQGDALMEIDSDKNEDNTPRQALHVANFTAYQPDVSSNNEGADKASTLFRGNSDTKLVNGAIITPNNECVRVNGTGSNANRATLSAQSVMLKCNSTKYLATGDFPYTIAEVAAIFGGSNNNDAFSASLTSVYAFDQTGLTATDPKTVDSFFDTTTYIGAVKDATDTWFAGWTCNSSFAPFDNTSNANRACTSLPVT